MRLARRVCSAAAAHAVVLFVLAVPAAAQQPPAPEIQLEEIAAAAGAELAATDAADQFRRPGKDRPRTLGDAAARPEALVPLYVSLGALQALDIHSTRRGLASSGGREANPVMAPVVKNGVAFVAVKAATTAGVIWASERLWRSKHRKAAVVLTTLTNIGLAAVVAHNYRVAR